MLNVLSIVNSFPDFQHDVVLDSLFHILDLVVLHLSVDRADHPLSTPEGNANESDSFHGFDALSYLWIVDSRGEVGDALLLDVV